ncbi:MFS transporter [Flavobacterium psychrophilum]|uniref:MFS transporter n=1 Tax=Flavobacterium psychrophilum TaxID=96345 RepID=UPI001D07CD97|nr:MFS transporter [Flavobacterium psychrophilum]MCB5994583.1 MFS transporter [Flavobacterium psychrophilum]MCB5996722.1 MFS transporter [Flavobacterium psychrophilum]MCB6004090.1 MFS transporter [Flavobacterium psychrophilum]MCB6006555.1 MFS transporter [Flavobacterium psychrophilum]MCB6019051.1 MFS transporter [Flavobacterium psychrophilum]
MIKKYFEGYKGFPKEIWVLALITFVNRAGTMVIPFMSKYLKEGLGFSYSQIGWIMVFFGIGSLIGTFLSGKISDKIGSYKVMVFSLFTSGLIFIGLQYVKTFSLLCFGIMLLTSVADMFRPAMMITLNSYVTKNQRTRALSLTRVAINLGFIFGPLLGGIIISVLGYNTLFFIDGGTCILAVLIFAYFVKEKKLLYKLNLKHISSDNYAPLKDHPFLLHWLITMLTGILFFQVFTTLPIYHRAQFGLTEFHSGLLLAFNGLLILLFEIPIVNYVEKNKIPKTLLIMIGLSIMSLSYLLLATINHPFVLIVMMFFMSFGVMLTFPFASAFVTARSHKNREGLFMSFFQMSYGFAHVLSAKTGMEIIDKFGFRANWFVNFAIGIVGVLLSYILYQMVKKERKKIKENIINSIFKDS